MKIITLKKNNKKNCCNSYLILGNLNSPTTITTMIDPGTDASILKKVKQVLSIYGNAPVSQVILTHSYVDQSGGAKALKRYYKSKTLALTAGPDIDELLQDGQSVDAGDDCLEVLHTPSDVSDSICLYAPSEKALFSGDMQLRLAMWREIYRQNHMDSLLKIACREILTIYSTHDEPVMRGSQGMILHMLDNVRRNIFITDNEA
ncbi:MBL fold metallo-hydrolase [Pelotalea chapellei]|uniref:MBL fold metallo-hydrolase n=1 Tax=Pelotalea chapellei TaxID=44671 RepID=A0ABS5U4D3_9BACT|nr:MBL fold metallo-hydrolase [Pelotalea chapellei]MBT1070536.1 MBL fold metallo-hydrolase [Pelotalea chapellei]